MLRICEFREYLPLPACSVGGIEAVDRDPKVAPIGKPKCSRKILILGEHDPSGFRNRRAIFLFRRRLKFDFDLTPAVAKSLQVVPDA